VLTLTSTRYPDFNDHHLTDILAEEHGIHLSRSSVRRLRREAGLASPRKRRAPRHRSWRQRLPQTGMLLQVDGSWHPWLEDRGPWLCLIAAVDDATGHVPWAVFRPQEDAAGYFMLLEHLSHTHGLPLAVYADRHTIFQSPKKASVAEELAGKLPRSQLGRLLDELAIQLIPAHSPQAKGRIERLFGTLQDRLVKALRQAGASTLEEANQVLQHFLPAYNTRLRSLPPSPDPPIALGQRASTPRTSSASNMNALSPTTTPSPSMATACPSLLAPLVAPSASQPVQASPTAASRSASSSTASS
jgi:transposase InsO family protein